MGKLPCYVCGMSKKKTYFDDKQPFADITQVNTTSKLVCTICMEKNTKVNDKEITYVQRQYHKELTDEQKEKLALSFDAVKFTNQHCKNNRRDHSIDETIKKLVSTKDRADAFKLLETIEVSNVLREELADYFSTLAQISHEITEHHKAKPDTKP